MSSDITRNATFHDAVGSLHTLESGVPGYVRTHPLTTDRIADMQDRVRGLATQKVSSSIEFYLLKARARLTQTTSSSNYPELKQYYESLLRKQDLAKQLEGSYGLALLSFKQQKNIDAENYLQKSRNLIQAICLMPCSYCDFAYINSMAVLSSDKLQR